ncbi:MAG: hypothetical protein RLZ10_121 [Bacteroidota bacterium]|jgi:diaminopimelate decarboxylase
MSLLLEEAEWTLAALISKQFVDANDTAVICQSWNQLNKYLAHLTSSFPETSIHAIAVKTNPHPKVLEHLVKLGYGLEAASLEEVQLAVKAGAEFSKIVFDSPVKTRHEINYCHDHFPGIRINVNCLEELNRMPEHPSFTLGIRINPMIDAGSPSLYHVSSDESKFGVPIIEKAEIIDAILKYPVTQLHVHAGSHMNNIDCAIDAVNILSNLADQANVALNENNCSRRIEYLDIGGGLPPEILYENKESRMQIYSSGLFRAIPGLKNYKIITEFGQWCYFYTAYAISKVEYSLKRGQKNVAFIHLGADYLMRDAYTKPRGIDFIVLNDRLSRKSGNEITYDIAGPLCFAGDYLIKNKSLPPINEGDWMMLLNTGSNSFGLWSRHCSRSIPKIFGIDYDGQNIELLSNRRNFY